MISRKRNIYKSCELGVQTMPRAIDENKQTNFIIQKKPIANLQTIKNISTIFTQTNGFATHTHTYILISYNITNVFHAHEIKRR